MIFLYALLAAYVTGGGNLLSVMVPTIQSAEITSQISIIIFTVVFGAFIILGTQTVDGLNRILLFTMLVALGAVLFLLVPEVKMDNLMAMPIDKALLISASPVFFTSFGLLIQYQV